MNKLGSIVIVEDDLDDQELMREALLKLNYKNNVIFFDDGHKALEYFNLTNIDPFLIISDINMPKLDGFALRDKAQSIDGFRLMYIPYIFFSTSNAERSISKAYSNSVNGFFVKPGNFDKLCDTLRTIIEYWQESTTPKIGKRQNTAN